MYQITVKNGDQEYPIWIPMDDELIVRAPVLTPDMSTAGSLTFQIDAVHPYADQLKALSSEIYAYQDDEIIFCGRMPRPVLDFYNTLTVTCEGELAYLLDSIVRPYDFTGDIPDFFSWIITNHNGQVEDRKKFAVGQIGVTDSNSYIRRSNSDFSNSLDALKGKRLETHGGYLRVRRQDGKRYLDYVTDYGGINSQAIRFGENLLDMNQYRDATQIITCLVPVGAKVETTNTDGSVGEKTIDITSVNGGKDYLVHEAGVSQYGQMWGTQKWDDVTEPENLLTKARAYLDECVALPHTLEIKAVDLSLIDVDAEKLKLGYWTTVESNPHGISKQFLLTKKEMHLDNPGKDRITMGQTIATFTGDSAKQQIQISDRVEQVANNASKEVNRKIHNATQLITGGRGGYFTIGLSEDGHPEETFWMDAPDKNQAKNIVRINKNGIGFSTTGINGPYRNAWTIDGNLVADFITVGTMLCDRIRGGTLELGGTEIGKDGSIIVKDVTGNQIGSWDKTGLSILRGILQGVSAVFGGANNQNGAIEVRDKDGKMIGRWDKDGISILRGVLQGVSAVFGGANNQNGAIEVRDKDGKKIGCWDKDGIDINNGTFSGEIISSSGIIGGWDISDDAISSSNVQLNADGSIHMWTDDDLEISFIPMYGFVVPEYGFWVENYDGGRTNIETYVREIAEEVASEYMSGGDL